MPDAAGTLVDRTAVPPYAAADLQVDRELVARMATGESGALQALYERHVGRVRGVAARILADPEEVREGVQDTFVKAWQQAATYRPDRGEVISWLLFIARNGAIDRLRRGVRRRDALALLAHDFADSLSAPQTAADGREFLDHPLADLSVPQRQALELAFFSGCSQLEIAERMQTPVGNVKNHLRRGLLKLRQLTQSHD
jgi:RNA polymerase sigma-70 factor (ECF subfamily)